MTTTGPAPAGPRADLSASDVVPGPPPTARPDEGVRTVWTRMRDQQLTVVAVVDQERCVGVLEVHVLWAAWALELAADRTVEALVSPTVCLRGDTTLPELCRAVSSSWHQAVLVVDDDGRLQGVVTAADVVGALAARAPV